MRKVCYTVIFGDGYKLNEVKYKTKGYKWDYVCFTDQDIKSKTWEIYNIDPALDNYKTSRLYKIFPPPKFWQYYSESIYLDARFTIKTDLNKFVANNLKNDIAIMKHHKRNCITQEAALLTLREVNQALTYHNKGMPNNFGLFAPGIMIRKHNRKVREFMSYWWREVLNNSHRDQIPLAYQIWKTGIMPDLMPFRETYELFMDRGGK